MPHWKSMIEKDHLGAWDLVGKDGQPKDFTLQIVSVESKLLKTVQQPKGKRKCVIKFRGAEKAFVCNATNGKTIESLYGPDTDGWIGKRITLYQTKVKNPDGGPPIPGIRVRPQEPGATKPAEKLESKPVDEKMRAEQNAAFGRGEVTDKDRALLAELAAEARDRGVPDDYDGRHPSEGAAKDLKCWLDLSTSNDIDPEVAETIRRIGMDAAAEIYEAALATKPARQPGED